MELSADRHPQVEVTFGGKNAHRQPEAIDAEEFIAKKGIAAKGKKVSQYEVESVRFIEPLHKPEDDIEEATPAEDSVQSDDSVTQDTGNITETGQNGILESGQSAWEKLGGSGENHPADADPGYSDDDQPTLF